MNGFKDFKSFVRIPVEHSSMFMFHRCRKQAYLDRLNAIPAKTIESWRVNLRSAMPRVAGLIRYSFLSFGIAKSGPRIGRNSSDTNDVCGPSITRRCLISV